VAETLFVSFIGWSRTGKTTFIVAALEECRRRGIPAAAVKRARREADIEPEGKDSALFLEAGAGTSIYVGDRTSVLFRPTPRSQGRDYYSSLLSGEALVFMEGQRLEGALTVLVAGDAKGPSDLKLPLSECDILIAEDPSLLGLAEGRLPVFKPGAAGDFLDYLEAARGGRLPYGAASESM
jgi:molybdopterin-guanine dinucleotide biosynthesis protein MobB